MELSGLGWALIFGVENKYGCAVHWEEWSMGGVIEREVGFLLIFLCFKCACTKLLPMVPATQ